MTIGAQIDQITLMQRAKNIYRTKPTIKDYEFINDKSERLIIAFKLPEFITNYMSFLSSLKTSLIGTLIGIEMGSNQRLDYLVERSSRPNTSSVIKRSFKSNMIRSSFYNNKYLSASMIGEPSAGILMDPLESHESVYSKDVINEAVNEDVEEIVVEEQSPEIFADLQPRIEEPQSMIQGAHELAEKYSTDFFTLLYNGFGLNAKDIIMRANDKPDRRDYGAALSNVIFGVCIQTPEGFQKIIEDLDTFAYPPIKDKNDTMQMTTTQSELLPSNRDHEILKKVVADDRKKTKLDFNRDPVKTLEFETEESANIKEDNFMFGDDDVEGELPFLNSL